MTSLLYLIAILVVGASAVFAFLNSQKHESLTKETFENRAKNDDLEKQIESRSGGKLKLADLKDANDKPKGATESEKIESAVRLVTERTLVGFYQADNVSPNEDRDEANQEEPYAKKVGGKKLIFAPYNKLVASGGAEEQLAFIQQKPEDEISAKAKAKAAKNVISRLEGFLSSEMANKISQLGGDVSTAMTMKGKLEEDIVGYEKAENKIKELFAAEGITTIEQSEKKLVELGKKREELNTAINALSAEKETLVTKREDNTAKLSSHSEYFSKRQESLKANGKYYSLAAVDQDWGFGVIKSSENDKFFINQRLMVLSGGRYVGELVVSAVEPGRVIANIDYKSLKEGRHFHTGDKVILSNPVSQ